MIQRPSRRAFVSSLAAVSGGLAITYKPRGAYAQQSEAPRHVGVLLVNVSPESKEAQAFRAGLRDAGYSDERLTALAAMVGQREESDEAADWWIVFSVFGPEKLLDLDTRSAA